MPIYQESCKNISGRKCHDLKVEVLVLSEVGLLAQETSPNFTELMSASQHKGAYNTKKRKQTKYRQISSMRVGCQMLQTRFMLLFNAVKIIDILSDDEKY